MKNQSHALVILVALTIYIVQNSQNKFKTFVSNASEWLTSSLIWGFKLKFNLKFFALLISSAVCRKLLTWENNEAA